jgi:hypothetical protein
MSRAVLVLLLGLAMSAAAVAGREGRAQGGSTCGAEPREGGSVNAQSAIATPQRPARIVPQDGPSLISESPALRLTLRPTATDADVPFLVQVFTKDLCGNSESGPGQLLGVVSFFPATIGKSQEFVLPAPAQGFPSTASQNIEITIKLIPANSVRELQHASLEVVKARFAE